MLAQSAVSLVKHHRRSADPHDIVLRHVAQQVLHVGNDSCAIRLIVGGEALDECRERARRLDALPDVAADVIETKVTAPFDTHHDDFAIHFRGKDRGVARDNGRVGNCASGLRSVLIRHW
jgi:hypothetical protein